MSGRRGFTLVELLTAIGITGVLMSILLPAIQSSHEAAGRLQCQNNLRQQGLAVQGHLAVHKHFPTNGWGYRWLGDPNRGFGADQPGGWIYNLLPYLEEQTLREFGKNKPPAQRHAALAVLMASDVPVFHCPSRGGGLQPANPIVSPYNATFAPMVAKTDYAINEGDYVTDTQAGPGTLEEGDKADYKWTDCRKATGISFQRSAVRPRQVTDGLTHTYLIGEKYIQRQFAETEQDPGYDQSMFAGVDYDLNRWTIKPPIPVGEEWEPRRFGGTHAVCYFVFCDGRVAPVDYAIDPDTHKNLGNRLDGLAVSLAP